ncbi:MAG: hypothetical protein WED15_04700 [Akkermansiaceae bacterium]
MHTEKTSSSGIPTLIVGLLLCANGLGQTTSRISSTFLARGEQAVLEVSVLGGIPDEFPEIMEVQNLSILPSGRGPMPGRRREFTFEYIVAGYEPGSYTIPAIEVMVGGLKTMTEPLDFMIFNPDELRWDEIEIGGKLVRYATSFRALNEQPYENQTTPAEMKLFVPEDLVVEDWGIPDFERDGVTAWRFQPSGFRGSRINLLGRRYVTVAYPSTLTPTRTGSVSIGPAKVRLTTREVISDPFPRLVNPQAHFTVPKLELEALPLPEGAPAGFSNAVGSFQLTAGSSVSEIEEGEPITVEIVVSGSGNLDTLQPPKLANDDGWKVYGTVTEQRGDERRLISGSVVFQQSIRPLEMKSEIPPFRFVYFDPRDKVYKTLLTEPITLEMRAGTARPPGTEIAQAMPVPFERMTDILAVLRPAQFTVPAATALPAWLLHGLGGLIALTLILKAYWMRYAPRLRKDPVRAARLTHLRAVEKSPPDDDSEFLRSAGGFIERWLGATPDPEIQTILAERDAVCFLDTKPKNVLDRRRRVEILKLLRKAAVALTFLITLGFASPLQASVEDTGRQALEAYDSGKYDEALKLWLGAGHFEELSADTLYNIGNACYRAGSAGQAALYYRRALARDSDHQEARQNLRFIERKYGSISVQRPEYQYALARFPLSTWQGIGWTGAWLCLLALLVIPATRPGARARLIAAAALFIGPLLTGVGLLGWRYFPNDAEFARLDRQAVIVAENVTLHTDAARTAPEVIDAPPGSLCEIISQSGRWAFVAFATKTRGWVPVESIEKVIPNAPPEVPIFRKPRSDSKTA